VAIIIKETDSTLLEAITIDKAIPITIQIKMVLTTIKMIMVHLSIRIHTVIDSIAVVGIITITPIINPIITPIMTPIIIRMIT